MTQTDLFSGHNAPASEEPQAPSVEFVRERLTSILDEARNASTLPWPTSRTHTLELLFVNMSKWLPDPEGERIKQAFSRELNRLLATSG
jgi:hypothetical protein